MLEVECYNVFIKHWAKSRKDLGEGLVRMNALCQEVWLDSLSIDSLRPPASMSKTHVHTYGGKGWDVTLNDREAFAGMTSLLEERWPERVPGIFRRLLTCYRQGGYAGLPFAFMGVEDGGQPLSVGDKAALLAGMTWREYTEVTIRGVVFKSRKARRSVHCNTGLMYPYVAADGSQKTMYGEIRRIFRLPEAAILPANAAPLALNLPPLLDVEWFVGGCGPALHGGRMPQVKRDVGLRSQWNREMRYKLADIAHAWNVVFWPLVFDSARAPYEPLVAIFRQSQSRGMDRHDGGQGAP
jgi:hypothetical protein